MRTSKIESTGANDLLDEIGDEFPIGIRRECDRCGNEYLTELEPRNSRHGPGLQIVCNPYCGCGKWDSICSTVVADISDPEEFRELMESEVKIE